MAWASCGIATTKGNSKKVENITRHGASPAGKSAQHSVGLRLRARKRLTVNSICLRSGWLWRHESGTYVKFTEAGAGRKVVFESLDTALEPVIVDIAH
jgi:hypothetical protein